MELLLIAVPLVLLIGGYVWYVSIVGRRNKALEALGGVDAHLQQRADLVPNLLRAAKRFMEHEKELLTEVTALRERATAPYDRKDGGEVAGHLAAAEAFGAKLGQLRVAVEAYPDLRSEATVSEAMDQMGEVEAQIVASRRYYNAAVTELNNAVQVWPGSMIAGMAKVDEMPFYEAADGARAPINADDYLR